MPSIALPSGTVLNPLYIRSVHKKQHFWGKNFYLTLEMRGQDDIHVEQLDAEQAEDLLRQIQDSIDSALSAAQAYDDAHDAGRADGYNDGHQEGHSKGYQEAKDAFWTYEREEYRINEYNVGFEAGKQAAKEAEETEWQKGYDQAKEQILRLAEEALSDAADAVIDGVMKEHPLQDNFSFRQIELALSTMSRLARRRLQQGE